MILWFGKTKKKFEIQVAGRNIFLIVFESEDDLAVVMAGMPWLFQKQLIVFDRLLEPVDRKLIRLISSPYWIKDKCSVFSDWDME